MTDVGLQEFLQIHTDFNVLGTLGRGGMGAVYMAEQMRLGRRVAVKVLEGPMAEDPRARERFLRETRAVASIDHPGVLPIYDAGEAGNSLYTIMRFVDGPDLRQYLTENGAQPVEKVRQLGTQVAQALGAAHARGVVHRDVKPANILLATFDVSGVHTYLCDFGLAKRLDSGPSLTKMDEIVGTVDYIAPEQIESGTVDARTDMYSLGCVVYEMLVGHPPFQGSSDIAVLWSHMRDEPPSVRSERPELPRQLDEFLKSAMAKSPADRPSGSAEFVSGLLAGEGDAASDPGPSSETLSRAALEAKGLSSISSVSSHETSGAQGTVDGAGGGSSGSDKGPTGADGGSAGVSGNRRRRRWWMGVAAGLAVLAIAGLVVGLTHRGNAPSTSMDTGSMGTGQHGMSSDDMSFSGGQTGSLTTVEKQLVGKLNPDLQSNCKGYSHQSWEHSVGAIRCTWPHQPITVTYIQLQNASWMQSHFDNYVEDDANSPKAGDCGTAADFTALQQSPTRFTEGGITGTGAPAARGSLICFREHGVPTVVWTNDGFNVLAEAAGRGVDSKTLLDFWAADAGPYGQP